MVSSMMGRLTPDQWRAIEPYLDGRTVYDLGAGNLELAHGLDKYGARKVIAVDRSPMPTPWKACIQTVQTHFHQLEAPDHLEVAFLSWPVNWNTDVEDLLERADIVVYVGCNTEGLSCGGPALWKHLTQRKVLVHAPARHNVLIVYGEEDPLRPFLPEEQAATDTDKVWGFDEIYGQACMPSGV